MPAPATTSKLTERQELVLAYIRRHMTTYGRPPTVREIGAGMGIRSPNGVMSHLRAMRQKGALRGDAGDSDRQWIPAVAPGHCPCCGQSLPREGKSCG